MSNLLMMLLQNGRALGQGLTNPIMLLAGNNFCTPTMIQMDLSSSVLLPCGYIQTNHKGINLIIQIFNEAYHRALLRLSCFRLYVWMLPLHMESYHIREEDFSQTSLMQEFLMWGKRRPLEDHIIKWCHQGEPCHVFLLFLHFWIGWKKCYL